MELLCPQWTSNKQSPGRMAQQNEEICKKGTPNLREVLECFQREQAATEVTVQQLEAGGERKAKRRKVVQREEKIQHELTTGGRNIDSYL